MRAAYERSLAFALAHTRGLLIGTGVLFAVALGLFFTLGRSFLPAFNEGSFTVNVATLPGVSLEESDKIGREVERIIMSIPEVNTESRKTGRAELAEHSFGPNVSELDVPYTLNGPRRGGTRDTRAPVRHPRREYRGRPTYFPPHRCHAVGHRITDRHQTVWR